mmetsp:Transcript_12233/g.42959  ORF Transcript_12233/g.42959 Transcript_12233/m.42959 type:complete len:446 (+) Transcript_12233:401-1738(+)
MILSSSSSDSATKRRYSTNMIMPRRMSSTHPKHLMLITTNSTIISRVTTEMNRPSLLMITSSLPSSTMPVLISHGSGSPTLMSKMLEPMEEETAMSPKPLRATITDDSASGIDVPPARMVRPMTASGMPSAKPMVEAHHTMRYEKMAIQMSETPKVTPNQFFHFSFWQLGMVQYIASDRGNEKSQNARLSPPSGTSNGLDGGSSSSSSPSGTARTPAPRLSPAPAFFCSAATDAAAAASASAASFFAASSAGAAVSDGGISAGGPPASADASGRGGLAAGAPEAPPSASPAGESLIGGSGSTLLPAKCPRLLPRPEPPCVHATLACSFVMRSSLAVRLTRWSTWSGPRMAARNAWCWKSRNATTPLVAPTAWCVVNVRCSAALPSSSSSLICRFRTGLPSASVSGMASGVTCAESAPPLALPPSSLLSTHACRASLFFMMSTYTK